MSWETVKLGEVIRHRKGFITISDDQEYKLCRVQLHRKGVLLRGITSGATIRTKRQQLCKANDFIVAEMDAKVGGYGFIPEDLNGAIVSSHYYLFEVNESLLNPDFLTVLSKNLVLQNQIKAVGSTNYARVSPKDVLAWEIPLPNLEEQKRIVEDIQIVETNKNEITTELSHQLELVSQLRQAFLREAMQGKLVPQDTADEPAAVLLEKIKAEKEKLIAEKKIKKQKPLPEIRLEEIPFEIPDTWIWCRLGEIFNDIKYGTSKSCNYDSSQSSAVLRIPNVSSGIIDGEDLKFTNLTDDEIKDLSLEENDILIIRSNGSRSLVGETALVTKEFVGYAYAGYLIRLRFSKDLIDANYLMCATNSQYFRELIETPLRTTVGINNINTTEISNLIVPLPPLAEQKRIEANIRESADRAEMLLQVALKEVLEPKDGNYAAGTL